MTPYFTERIETHHGYINFYFNRIYTAEGVRYHVSCFDKRQKVHAFIMKQLLGQWTLDHPSQCLLWIRNLEPEFVNAILKNQAK